MEAYELQTEKMQLENEIAIKEGEISELKTEVTHLASYDRIYEKANELGLDLNNGNVKVETELICLFIYSVIGCTMRHFRIYERANEVGLDLNNESVKVAEKYGKD